MATIIVPNNFHEKVLKVVTTDYIESLVVQFLNNYNDNTTIGQIAHDMISSLGGEYLDTDSTYVKYNQSNQFTKFNISGELSANQLSAKNKEIVEVKIGTNISCIGENAFENCTSLSSVNIPDSVKHIKQNAFKNCSALPDVKFPAFMLSADDCVFENCTSLSSVDFNGELLHIGNNAFKNCQQLKTISIPDSISFLGAGAFSDCINLEYVNLPTTLDTIRDNTFYNCKKLAVPLEFLAYVTYIGKFAFYGCDSITALSLAKNLTAIGGGAFANCKNLTEFIVDGNHHYTTRAGCIVSFDNDVVAVPCTKTDEDINILMALDVQRINDYAFCGNENVTTINIPANIEHIGNYAFKDCTNLVKVVFAGSKPTTGFSIFSNVSPVCAAYAYQTGGWKSIKIPGIWNNINIKNATALD